jgi:hypothetical protein
MPNPATLLDSPEKRVRRLFQPWLSIVLRVFMPWIYFGYRVCGLQRNEAVMASVGASCCRSIGHCHSRAWTDNWIENDTSSRQFMQLRMAWNAVQARQCIIANYE